LKDVAYNEIALGDDDEQSNVSPSKQGELFHVVAFDQGKDEPNEANDVQGEGDEAVVFDYCPQKLGSFVHNAKVINQAFTIKEIVGGNQEIPGQ